MNISRIKNLLVGAALVAVTCVPGLGETLPQDHTPLAELWVHTSAEYHGLCHQAYNVATMQFEKWEPLFVRGEDGKAYLPGSDKPVAIILDLDETVINNSGYQAFLNRVGAKYTPATWDAWLEFQAVNKKAGRALPGSVDFLRRVEKMGVTPIYISNRAAGYEDETITVLRNAGVNMDDIESRVLLRKKGADLAHEVRQAMELTGIEEESEEALKLTEGEGLKEGRRLLIKAKYDVVAYFGDVYGDFEPFLELADSGKAKFQQRIESADANSEKFGRSWFILPNPMYGYWGVGQTIPKDQVREALDDFGFEVFLRGRRKVK